MQEENALTRTFLHRTDTLASRLKINVQELPEKIGISRRTLFAGRSDNQVVTTKTWHKLEQAERAAGLVTALPDQLAAEPEALKRAELIQGAGFMELVGMLGPVGQRIMMDAKLEGLSHLARQFFGDAEALATVALRVAATLDGGEMADDLTILAGQVQKNCPALEEWLEALILVIKKSLSADEP